MITPLNQRWRKHRASYRPAGEPIQTRLYEVAEIADDATARAYVVSNHYSRSYPSARRRFGLYRSAQLVGVAVFSHPSNDKTLTNIFIGTKATDSVELGRFVLDDDVPGNGESWFLARCREIIRKDFIGLVSFSDDTPRTDAANNKIFSGHVGCVYQSSNAVYLSRGTARNVRLLPDGRVLSARAISKIRAGESGWKYASDELTRFGASLAPEDNEERRVWLARWLSVLTRNLKHPGNHRYAWVFDKHYRLPASLPYPKLTLTQLQPVLF